MGKYSTTFNVEKRQHGGVDKDHSKSINVVILILTMGPSWRDFPLDYRKWRILHQRFIRRQWKDNWNRLCKIFRGNQTFE